VVDEEPLAVDEVLQILDETSEVLAYSRALERKSQQLQQATTELRQANDRLQELDRLKDEFVSTVSHELRTPLTSIRAFSEILSDNPDLDVAERSEYLQIIVAETERLTRLINQVLDLSKLESGSADWHIDAVDLGEVVATSVQATAQIFRDRRVALEVNVPDPAPTVWADRDRLVQVLLNLLSNAVKFCAPETGRVQITVGRADNQITVGRADNQADVGRADNQITVGRADNQITVGRADNQITVGRADNQITVGRYGDFARVDVSDNGPGIADEDHAVIFEKFRQGGDTRINRPAGTGLGLPISREIVDHLGGRLWVESSPGRGAVFSFTLPVAVVGAAASAEEGAS
jgi:signal transduction histidine kinase